MILGLLSGIGLPKWAVELLAGAIIILVLVGGSAYLGYHYKADADEVAQQKAEIAHAAQLLKLQAVGDDIAAKYQALSAHTADLEGQLAQRVPNVTKVYRTAPGAALESLPRCVFTGGFVGVWNGALDPVLPAAAGGAAQPAAAAGPPGPDPDLDSGLDEQAVLSNHVANGARCAALTEQLNALIDWHKATDGAVQP